MLPLVQLVVPAVSAEDCQCTKLRLAVQHNTLNKGRCMISKLNPQLNNEAVVHMLLSLDLRACAAADAACAVLVHPLRSSGTPAVDG